MQRGQETWGSGPFRHSALTIRARAYEQLMLASSLSPRSLPRRSWARMVCVVCLYLWLAVAPPDVLAQCAPCSPLSTAVAAQAQVQEMSSVSVSPRAPPVPGSPAAPRKTLTRAVGLAQDDIRALPSLSRKSQLIIKGVSFVAGSALIGVFYFEGWRRRRRG